MNVIQATSSDLVDILYLLKVCVQDLNLMGWIHSGAQCYRVNESLSNGNIFLYKNDGVTLGMIVIDQDIEPKSQDVAWDETSKKPLYVNRFIIHPKWENSIVAQELLTFLEEYGHQKGYSSIRLEEFPVNSSITEVVNHKQYKESGNFLMQCSQKQVTCFEKLLF